jgi:hypothetical protein
MSPHPPEPVTGQAITRIMQMGVTSVCCTRFRNPVGTPCVVVLIQRLAHKYRSRFDSIRFPQNVLVPSSIIFVLDERHTMLPDYKFIEPSYQHNYKSYKLRA